MLDDLPHLPTYVVCDREYASHKFREDLWNHGFHPVIPPRKNDPELSGLQAPASGQKTCGQDSRNGGGVATRYEQTAVSFLSVIFIAATADYIKA
ncbi:transposase (plasmid) [Komagataeibacter sucrofermentans]|uniref:transposase n=1 Tax=Komagataeibacter sucrofermentans TaxID=1053551 RepID=UPI001ABFC913|nr:transposase [Komagataeibacter sucrofermentans]